jgi:hypothetical protein
MAQEFFETHLNGKSIGSYATLSGACRALEESPGGSEVVQMDAEGNLVKIFPAQDCKDAVRTSRPQCRDCSRWNASTTPANPGDKTETTRRLTAGWRRTRRPVGARINKDRELRSFTGFIFAKSDGLDSLVVHLEIPSQVVTNYLCAGRG